MRFASVLCILGLMVGCASIIAPNSESVKIDSDPPGQHVMIDGQSYSTPAVVTLGRDAAHIVRFPNGQEVAIERSFQGWFLGNLLLGGIPGMVVDLLTGAVNRDLHPDHLLYKGGVVYNAATNKPVASGKNEKSKDSSQPRP